MGGIETICRTVDRVEELKNRECLSIGRALSGELLKYLCDWTNYRLIRRHQHHLGPGTYSSPIRISKNRPNGLYGALSAQAGTNTVVMMGCGVSPVYGRLFT